MSRLKGSSSCSGWEDGSSAPRQRSAFCVLATPNSNSWHWDSANRLSARWHKVTNTSASALGASRICGPILSSASSEPACGLAFFFSLLPEAFMKLRVTFDHLWCPPWHRGEAEISGSSLLITNLNSGSREAQKKAAACVCVCAPAL